MTTVTWIRPPPGVLKINVKGLAGRSGLLSSVGCVARNITGYWIGSYAGVMSHEEQLSSELFAIYYGFKLAIDMEARSIEIESDSDIAVQHVLNPDPMFPRYDIVVLIRELMYNQEWNSCVLRGVPISSNQLAITLAIYSFEEGDEISHIHFCPSRLVPTMAEDWLASY